MNNILLIAFIISLASVIGVFFVQKTLGKYLDKNIHYFMSFSAGVFIIVSGSLIIESWHLSESFIETIILILIGFICSWFLAYLFPEFHHHHDDCCSGHKNKATKVIVGDAIHNVADGLVLVSAFFSSYSVGLALAFSILIHEILQEISEFFILRESGYSVKKAIFINFLTSLTIFIGVGLGFMLGNTERIQSVILALSAGFLLNIVFTDLLPHTHKENKSTLLKQLLILTLGLILMLYTVTFFMHGHGDHSEVKNQEYNHTKHHK